MNIELLSLNIVNVEHQKAEARVKIGSVTVLVKVIQQPGLPPWVALPEAPIRDAGGKNKWRRICEVDNDEWFQVRKLVLSEYHEQLEFAKDFGFGE